MGSGPVSLWVFTQLGHGKMRDIKELFLFLKIYY